MLIITQDKEKLIGDGFIIYYKNRMLEGDSVVYVDSKTSQEIVLGKYDNREDCLEQIAVIMLQLKEDKEIWVSEAEMVREVHEKRKEKERLNGRS